jgi:hypothetical protein
MVFELSVIGSLLLLGLLGYFVVHVKANREAKKSIRTLFDSK